MCISWALLANLQRRSLKLGRLIVLQETHLRLQKLLLPWQLTLFQSPPTWFQYVSDFQLEKRYTRPQTQEKHIYMLVGKSPPSKITLKPLSCFDITMQRGCNILISYMVLDTENAISRASFVQIPSYRSARRQMNHVFCSVTLKSILKFRPYLRATV